MPRKPLEQQKTLRETTTFCRPRDFDIKQIAKQLQISQGELIRLSVKEYAVSRGISI